MSTVRTNLKLFLLSIICVYAPLSGLVIESDSIETVRKYVDGPDTLVVFDIDNTLIKSKGDFGGDTWFHHMFHKYMHEGLSAQQAADKLRAMSVAIHEIIDFELVEECVVQLVRDLQQQTHVIALTARSYPLIESTEKQFARLGIDFTSNNLPSKEMRFYVSTSGKYKYGILFCQSNNKGTVLLQFFGKIGYHPTKIVFIDDKMKNIVAVEQMAEEQNIPFVGIRYSRLDDWVKSFDATQVEKQHQLFVQEHAELIAQCTTLTS